MKQLLAFLILIISISIMAQTKQMDVNVPAWAKKAVWYQIFPERFSNGDIFNDPTLESIKGSWPHDYKSPFEIHSWTSDWYRLEPYEKKNGKDIWFNIQRRRYGGDLQGIIDKLDYLKDLGITAIYLNPIFEAPSLHKYDASTYHHVDPHFGPDIDADKLIMAKEDPGDSNTWDWTEADKLFIKLIKEVHKRNMKIIIDGVFNHMGINSWAFQDVLKNQKNSKYKDWFTIISWDDAEKGTKFDYEGWFGVKELPELREDKNGIVEGPKDYIFDITNRWMDPDGDGDPADGIDGWRLDVAFCVQHQFWKDWRKHVKSINPDAYITAEIVDPPKDVKPYLQGDEFDAVMNYNYLFAVSDYFSDDKTAVSTSKFDKLLKDLRNAFPEEITYVQMNLNNSHDTERLLTNIVNRDKYKIRDWGHTFDLRKGSNKNYDTRKPNDYEIAVNKLITIFQFTYVGAPYVYYGEECGMWGANDPDCRKPMVWPDFKYEEEKYLPNQTLKPSADKVEFNKDLFEHYKKMISIRNDNEVLQTGKFKTLKTDDADNVYAYSRFNDKDEIIVILNNSNEEQKVNLKTNHKEYYKDLLSGQIVKTEKGTINVSIPHKWGMILKKDYYK
ncbi:MAG TPA: glycoside hydrolase family 13 protein [Ignavibacteriaceae bacterium]|nr:glycoside hydrolase family 13 protein [Ignavibacteriaceae bacterium]